MKRRNSYYSKLIPNLPKRQANLTLSNKKYRNRRPTLLKQQFKHLDNGNSQKLCRLLNFKAFKVKCDANQYHRLNSHSSKDSQVTYKMKFRKNQIPASTSQTISASSEITIWKPCNNPSSELRRKMRKWVTFTSHTIKVHLETLSLQQFRKMKGSGSYPMQQTYSNQSSKIPIIKNKLEMYLKSKLQWK